MKVNDIIVDEGFWDSIKAGATALKGKALTAATATANAVKSAKGAASYGSSPTTHANMGNKIVNNVTASTIKRWEVHKLPTLSAAVKADPSAYKKYLDRFLNQYYREDYSSDLELQTTDSKAVREYIKQATYARNNGDVVQPKQEQPGQEQPGASTTLDTAVASDISAALKQLGYSPAQVQELVASTPPGSSVEDGIRIALSGSNAAAAPARSATNAAPVATSTTPTTAPAGSATNAAPVATSTTPTTAPAGSATNAAKVGNKIFTNMNSTPVPAAQAAKLKQTQSIERVLFGTTQLSENDLFSTVVNINKRRGGIGVRK